VTAQPGETSKIQGPPMVAGSLYGGFGDALAQAFEFAIVPVLFALAGVGLDAWLGTGPWLTIVFVVFGLSGVIARTLYSYKARIELEEEGKPWTRRARR
jgi:F0F1-type ATP synthase assembly protein I